MSPRMQMTPRTRKAAGVVALALGASTLGACLDLGNGSDPNCSEDKIAALYQKLDEVEFRLLLNDESENPIHESILIEKARALEAALDVCDAPTTTTQNTAS